MKAISGTLTARTNQEWIQDLTGAGAQQTEALEGLRDLLLRASLYALSRSLDDLGSLDYNERVAFAEDCAQDALLAVLAHLGEFRGESKFTTWVYKFGVNVTLTRARRERWKHLPLEKFSEDGAELDWLQWKVRTSPSVSELPALQAEVIGAIKETIRSELTVRQREILKLIAFDQVPMDVIVERLGTNRNAIYKMLHDARLKVKRHLLARGYDIQEIYHLFGQNT
jgi:RNA polymerase sigma-70 factor (ECF subfamily)